MADRSARAARLPCRALLPLLIGLAFAPSSRAEIKVTPSVTVQETWTDNVNQASSNQARSEFITEIAPGLSVVENTPRVKFSGSYQFHEYLYSDKNASNLHNNSSDLHSTLNARVIDDLLFLDATAARSLQAVSAFGPQVTGNPYNAANSTEISTWRVSPYVVQRIGTSANLIARYTKDSTQTNVLGYGNTQGDEATVTLTSAGNQRIGWSLSYDRQLLNDRFAGDSTTVMALAGLSWRVRPGFSLTSSVGYDDNDYHALGGRTRGRNWSVGFAYIPSDRTSLTMSVGRRYFGNSRALAALHRSRHTVWNLSYDEQVTTTRAQYMLPATVDTTSLLDNLFKSSIADPELRRQAVDAYIAATGLPPSLVNNINFLSNRYFLQKQFLASVGMRGARSALMLSAFDTRRTALSLQETDSQLLGNNQLNLYDNVRQRGLTASFSYRMSSHTDAIATAETSHADSLDTGVRQTNRSLRLGLHRQFLRKLQGAAELRHLTGSYSYSQAYTENAISASLSMMF
jgi:uncharacterized protein (PEP-CTERM system associated)